MAFCYLGGGLSLPSGVACRSLCKMSTGGAAATMDTVVKRVSDFWFGETDNRYFYDESQMKLWFMGGPEGDEKIRSMFGGDVEAALAGKYDALVDGPHGVQGNVALVVLLDQFTRNLFRKTAKAFSGDAKALEVVTQTLDSRMGEVKSELRLGQRSFLLVPLMHSENLAVQDRGVAMFEEFLADVKADGEKAKQWMANAEAQLRFAKVHRDLIARFGRFPYRNEVLGRVSTPEEEEYLKDGERFGQ